MSDSEVIWPSRGLERARRPFIQCSGPKSWQPFVKLMAHKKKTALNSSINFVQVRLWTKSIYTRE